MFCYVVEHLIEDDLRPGMRTGSIVSMCYCLVINKKEILRILHYNIKRNNIKICFRVYERKLI